MNALGLLIPGAAAALIIWRLQSPRPETGLLATTVVVPAAMVACVIGFTFFIALMGTHG